MSSNRYNNILLKLEPKRFKFTSLQSVVPKKPLPLRDRIAHSKHLIQCLNEAWEKAENAHLACKSDCDGIYLEFAGEPGYALATTMLESMPQGIRLLNIRTVPATGPSDGSDAASSPLLFSEDKPEQAVEDMPCQTLATVFVPHDKKGVFLKKLNDYASKETKKGNPSQAAIASISEIRKAVLQSFWTDDSVMMPESEQAWCEVWLSTDDESRIASFDRHVKGQQVNMSSRSICFPERTVKIVLANRAQLEQLIETSDSIAEFRRAKEASSFWTEMPPSEQAEWTKELLSRISVSADPKVSVCILDTGVNNGHPLLARLLRTPECQTVDAIWGTHDHHGHGTLMAGLAGYSDLRDALASQATIAIEHCLESVKILPPPPQQNAPELWGDLTAQGISLAEIQEPERQRVICMAIAAPDTRDRGRPSSWSGMLDQVTSGAQDDRQRLMIVSAGNTANTVELKRLASDYPDIQMKESIHDPAQAWNVLTVGAFTNLTDIADPSFKGYNTVAPLGGLSPFSSTSLAWDAKSNFASEADGLSTLSTFWKPEEHTFHPFNMTSAACAGAAHMAAVIQSRNPDYWPETIRALMVHSAEWPDALKDQVFRQGKSKKANIKQLLGICGYGVPILERALYSASNSLTLIAQAEIQPFKADGAAYKTNEMNFHMLPWPKEALLELGETPVRMRVTLSYFIEPGPGEIGWKDRYRYASHALRFEMNAPGETMQHFFKRINMAVRTDKKDKPETKGPGDYWLIGPNSRDRGSLHSDTWEGTAADLATSNMIAVCPVIGWWRERSHLRKVEKKARYSLVVTISTPEETMDVYTPVAIQVGIAPQIQVSASPQ